MLRRACDKMLVIPEWRNGRRVRLKIEYPKGCVGSTPSSGTKFCEIFYTDNLIYYRFRCFKRLKIPYRQLCVGSTPSSGTNLRSLKLGSFGWASPQSCR